MAESPEDLLRILRNYTLNQQRCFELPTHLLLSLAPDPQPAIASCRQAQQRLRIFQFHSPTTELTSDFNSQSPRAA